MKSVTKVWLSMLLLHLNAESAHAKALIMPEDHFLSKIEKHLTVLSKHLAELKDGQLESIKQAFHDPSKAEDFFQQSWEYISFGEETTELMDFVRYEDVCFDQETVVVNDRAEAEVDTDYGTASIVVSSHVPEAKTNLTKLKVFLNLLSDKRFDHRYNLSKLESLRAECIKQKDILSELKDNTMIFCQMCQTNQKDNPDIHKEEEETLISNFCHFPEIDIYNIYGHLHITEPDFDLKTVKTAIERVSDTRLKRQLEYVFRYEINKLRYDNFLQNRHPNFRVQESLVTQAVERIGEFTLLAQDAEDIQVGIKRIIEKQQLAELKLTEVKPLESKLKSAASMAQDKISKFFMS